MDKIGKPQDNYLKSLGSRIRCELNDLKRTPQTAANELGFSEKVVASVLEGKAEHATAVELVDKMGEIYPIDSMYLRLLKKDTADAFKFMSNEESRSTSRVYRRTDGYLEESDYYEYRDTAMSNLAPLKPEWIRVLKEVQDSNPDNLKVVMNNGHFMHQVTLFIGPVNFYYEDEEGNQFCHEMNTGDSNYITPFVKHSFASRNKEEFTCILAVTYGGDVSRSQRELYALGNKKLNSFLLKDGFASLLNQQAKNSLFSIDMLDSLVRSKDGGINIKSFLDSGETPAIEELGVIASCLGVGVEKLIPSKQNSTKCIITKFSENDCNLFPNPNSRLYRIFSLANDRQSDLMKASIVEVLGKKHDPQHYFERSLHSYLINYTDAPAELSWEHNGKYHTKKINKFDSVYLEPFTRFSITNSSDKLSRLLIVGVKSSVSLQAQRELSSFLNPERVINELGGWYEKE